MPDSARSAMTVAEWDAYLGGVADSTEFILGDKFECEDGRALVRMLAEKHWPTYRENHMYAKAGDNSNLALRRLQRKYHAALKMLHNASDHKRKDSDGP